MTDAKAKLVGFTNYHNVKGELDQMRLICQVDSLHRIKILPNVPTVLILDEIKQIHAQFDNKNIEQWGNSDAIFQMFNWLMHNSKYIIAMDAMAKFCSYELLRNLLMQINEWRPERELAGNDEFYPSPQEWEAAVMRATDTALDKPFVVATNSSKQAKYLATECKKRNPEAVIKMYCSDSIPEERKDFENVNEEWVKCHILIYTSTISAVISFKQEHFDKVFGYFTNYSTLVKTSVQMLGRVKEYHICIDAANRGLPDTVEVVEKSLRKIASIADLPANMQKDSATWEIIKGQQYLDHMGESDFLCKDMQYYICLNNIVERNRGKNNYLQEFV
ncbi:hypothetical protein QOT17_022443 [Balamuthia mandrillaris]